MFGFGKSKTEKMVLKLERLMMIVENAYNKGKFDCARYGIQRQHEVLRWLNIEGEWPEEKVVEYIRNRGLVRSISDEAYMEEMSEKLMVL